MKLLKISLAVVSILAFVGCKPRNFNNSEGSSNVQSLGEFQVTEIGGRPGGLSGALFHLLGESYAAKLPGVSEVNAESTYNLSDSQGNEIVCKQKPHGGMLAVMVEMCRMKVNSKIIGSEPPGTFAITNTLYLSMVKFGSNYGVKCLDSADGRTNTCKLSSNEGDISCSRKVGRTGMYSCEYNMKSADTSSPSAVNCNELPRGWTQAEKVTKDMVAPCHGGSNGNCKEGFEYVRGTGWCKPAPVNCSEIPSGWINADKVTKDMVAPCHGGSGGTCKKGFEYVSGTGWCKPKA